MPESKQIKSIVYALYDKTRSTPSGVLEIEKEKGIIHIGIEEPFLARLKDAWILAWHLVRHKGFTVSSHTMEEKTGQEIADWYAGKGLK
jgi:hypothetical protein